MPARVLQIRRAIASTDQLCGARLHELAPILRERELCKDQGLVLRSLLDVLDAAVGSVSTCICPCTWSEMPDTEIVHGGTREVSCPPRSKSFC